MRFKLALSKYKYFNEPLTVDWIIYGLIALVSTFLFFHPYDLLITSWHSNDLLDLTKDGKLLHFYKEVFTKASNGGYFSNGVMDAANYNIVIYIVLAVWLLPFRILLAVFKYDIPYNSFAYLYWCKVLILIFQLLTGRVLFDLLEKLKSKNAKASLYIALTSPLLIYGSLIWGQVDIIEVFFMLVALKCFWNKDTKNFLLFGSIACCFKGFSLLAFLPLILLYEKRILRILGDFAAFAVMPILTRVIFIDGYRETSKAMEEIYHFSSSLWATGIPGGTEIISLFVVGMVVLCLWCFLQKETNHRKDIFAIWTSFSIFFLFVDFHEQWLVYLVPFCAIAFALTNQKKILSILYVFMSWSYVLFLLTHFRRAISHSFCFFSNYGRVSAFSAVAPNNIVANTFGNMSGVLPFSIFASTIISVSLILYLEIKKEAERTEADRGLIYLNILSIVVFEVLSVIVVL